MGTLKGPGGPVKHNAGTPDPIVGHPGDSIHFEDHRGLPPLRHTLQQRLNSVFISNFSFSFGLKSS